MTPQELELETTGRFEVTVIPGADESCRCGLPGSPRNLAYKVLIVSHPEFLDENGFIIDWQVVRDWFLTAFTSQQVFPSCERIACMACTHIARLLDGRVSRIEVTIGSGVSAAGMKAVWYRPRNYPPVPVNITPKECNCT